MSQNIIVSQTFSYVSIARYIFQILNDIFYPQLDA